MATISVCFYGIFIILLVWIFGSVANEYFSVGSRMDDFLGTVTCIIALPYFFDFLTLGLLKRFKFIQAVYKPIYWFMSIITLASLYRGIYYGLLSQLNRKYLIAGVLLFVSITATSIKSVNQSGKMGRSEMMVRTLGSSTIDGYYRDQNPDRFSTWAHIQSATIENGVLEVFLVHKVQYERLIIESCDDNRVYVGDLRIIESPVEKNIACLVAFCELKIDGEPVKVDRFFMRELASTEQTGLFTWIDVSHLSKGIHRLEVCANNGKDEHSLAANIPFYQTSGSNPNIIGLGVNDPLKVIEALPASD